MIKAVEAERHRVSKEWEAIKEAKNKLTAKRDVLRGDKKLLDEALRKLASIDRGLEKRLSKVDSLVDDSSKVRKECRQIMEDCKAIESAR